MKSSCLTQDHAFNICFVAAVKVLEILEREKDHVTKTYMQGALSKTKRKDDGRFFVGWKSNHIKSQWSKCATDHANSQQNNTRKLSEKPMKSGRRNPHNSASWKEKRRDGAARTVRGEFHKKRERRKETSINPIPFRSPAGRKRLKNDAITRKWEHFANLGNGVKKT